MSFSIATFSASLTIDNASCLSSFIFVIKLSNFIYSASVWAFEVNFWILSFNAFLASWASFEVPFGYGIDSTFALNLL
ncbi:hypothetical protein [Mycoplasmopsis cynos]|uniref:hypothetical protein n=1 Tax=Mycoplasmopsis cynos TaxID=171284 RepID=UPI0024C9AE22|nr:hypothetical protein [Mycoplasmopsis cynos]WAM05164.1 hypothetical protein ONA01_03475 [Mycoplasmopsis cynos]